ncbi:MAG: hypothetical protein ACRCTP_04255 [Aeromonas popoffii]|uniref:hypothetical protein n=1 Tax=Aeromonas popoffii TaxID=70856 RepID=UPI003F3AC775
MNLTKLASGAYDLKVTVDKKEVSFTSNEFANANQLHAVMSKVLEGISSLKKSTFYGVKFEEVVPGVFVGERRIPGFGLYHFQFTGAPVALDVGPFDDTVISDPLSESCSGACDGNGGCGNLCCKAEQPFTGQSVNINAQTAANEDNLEVSPGFKLSELGSGPIKVMSTDQVGERCLLGGMRVSTGLVDAGRWNSLLNCAPLPSGDCVIDPDTLMFFKVEGKPYYTSVTQNFIFIFGESDDYLDLSEFEPFVNPFEEVMFRDLGAGYLSVVDLRIPGSAQGEQLWYNSLGSADRFWEVEAPLLYPQDLPEVWSFDHNHHPFFYDPSSGHYVSERWPLGLHFKRAATAVCQLPAKKLTLKETFLGWLKNILG